MTTSVAEFGEAPKIIDLERLQQLSYERSKIWATFLDNIHESENQCEISLDQIDEFIDHTPEDENELASLEDDSYDDNVDPEVLRDITNTTRLSLMINGNNKSMLPPEASPSEANNELIDMLNETLPVINEHNRQMKETGLDRILNTFDAKKIEEKVGGWLRRNNSLCGGPEYAMGVPTKERIDYACRPKNTNTHAMERFYRTPTAYRAHKNYHQEDASDSDDSFNSGETARYIRSSRAGGMKNSASTTMMIKTYRMFKSTRQALRDKYACDQDEDTDSHLNELRLRRRLAKESALHHYQEKHMSARSHKPVYHQYMAPSSQSSHFKRRKILRKRNPSSTMEDTSSESDSYYYDDVGRNYHRKQHQTCCSQRHCSRYAPALPTPMPLSRTAPAKRSQYSVSKKASTFSRNDRMYYYFKSHNHSMSSSPPSPNQFPRMGTKKPLKRLDNRPCRRESDCRCCDEKRLCQDYKHLADTSTEEWVVENCFSPRKPQFPTSTQLEPEPIDSQSKSTNGNNNDKHPVNPENTKETETDIAKNKNPPKKASTTGKKTTKKQQKKLSKQRATAEDSFEIELQIAIKESEELYRKEQMEKNNALEKQAPTKKRLSLHQIPLAPQESDVHVFAKPPEGIVNSETSIRKSSFTGTEDTFFDMKVVYNSTTVDGENGGRAVKSNELNKHTDDTAVVKMKKKHEVLTTNVKRKTQTKFYKQESNNNDILHTDETNSEKNYSGKEGNCSVNYEIEKEENKDIPHVDQDQQQSPNDDHKYKGQDKTSIQQATDVKSEVAEYGNGVSEEGFAKLEHQMPIWNISDDSDGQAESISNNDVPITKKSKDTKKIKNNLEQSNSKVIPKSKKPSKRQISEIKDSNGKSNANRKIKKKEQMQSAKVLKETTTKIVAHQETEGGDEDKPQRLQVNTFDNDKNRVFQYKANVSKSEADDEVCKKTSDIENVHSFTKPNVIPKSESVLNIETVSPLLTSANETCNSTAKVANKKARQKEKKNHDAIDNDDEVSKLTKEKDCGGPKVKINQKADETMPNSDEHSKVDASKVKINQKADETMPNSDEHSKAEVTKVKINQKADETMPNSDEHSKVDVSQAKHKIKGTKTTKLDIEQNNSKVIPRMKQTSKRQINETEAASREAGDISNVNSKMKKKEHVPVKVLKKAELVDVSNQENDTNEVADEETVKGVTDQMKIEQGTLLSATNKSKTKKGKSTNNNANVTSTTTILHSPDMHKVSMNKSKSRSRRRIVLSSSESDDDCDVNDDDEIDCTVVSSTTNLEPTEEIDVAAETKNASSSFSSSSASSCQTVIRSQATTVTNVTIKNTQNKSTYDPNKGILIYAPQNSALAPAHSFTKDGGFFNITLEHLSTIIGQKSAEKFLKYYIGRRRFNSKSTVYFRPPATGVQDTSDDSTSDSDDDDLEFIGRYGDLYESFGGGGGGGGHEGGQQLQHSRKH